MKHILTKLLIVFMLIPLTFTSCTEDFEQMNVNPNQPTVVPNTNLLISSITSGTRRIHGASFNMTYAGAWSQQYAKIQYIDEDWYSYRDAAFDAHWNYLYAGALLTDGTVVPGPLQDLQIIINKTEADEPNMRAAAMTMQAYYFSVITDMWGDIPYFQALQGPNNVQPVYDTQESIYKDLEQKLATAAAMFDEGADALGQGDVLYGGSISNWRKFANSLRARILNRYKHKDAAAESALIALLNSGDLMSSNADDADLFYPDGAVDTKNPIFENRNVDNRVDHAVSKTMIDMLMQYNDPRLDAIAEPNDEGNYVGQPNGSIEPERFTAVSYVGRKYLCDVTAPSTIMSFAELMFIKAEALNDKQAYLDGINASIAKNAVTISDNTYELRTNVQKLDSEGVGVTEPNPCKPEDKPIPVYETAEYSADDFMNAVSAAYDANPLEAIINQKWIALFGNGAEAFSEYRRTKYPATVQEVPGSVYPGKGVPHRFAYPVTEFGVNETNLDAAIARQNVDATGIFGDEMWWVLR